ncbi:hypothetical protein [Aquimarina sp. AU474]|uniref:hypothetical protein n=1 Tax=Aquimarina sp. AU474 TaxID=2108529 RepID=UPI001357FA97|nr:hypothetical protein [Aquimarina sp. AU474]
MKKAPLYILFIALMNVAHSQIGPNDANALLGLPNATDLTEINAILTPQIGAVVYNLADDQIYRFTSSGWQVVNGENIYNTNGALNGERTVDMAANQLNFDISSDTRTTLSLRRTNNANSVGIAFRNSGNAYPTAIVLGSAGSGNSNGLDFYAGGNDGNADNLNKTLALQNSNQIEFSQYGTANTFQFDNNAATRFLGIENDGDVVTIDPSTIVDTDDQDASEVNSDTPVDVDGDGAMEATVEDVIQDIAPITSKAARIFYPPSITINASTTGTGFTEDLYDEYVDQFTLANPATSASSNGAPGTIPIYNRDELYYYVTFADPAVFSNITIGGTGDGVNEGVMTYNIVGTPLDFNTLINVVFVVK